MSFVSFRRLQAYHEKLKIYIAGLLAGFYTKSESDDAHGILEEAIGIVDTKANNILSGTTPVALAKNLESWEGRNDLSVPDTWTDVVRTTAGDVSINSENGGQLVSIYPVTDYYASGLMAGGFNRLRNATRIGSGETWVLDGDVLPALPQGDGNPQGIVLTDANGIDIGSSAVVYYKATSPVTGGLGTVITPVVKTVNGKTVRFFPTTAPGYITVAFTGQATRATSCAHIGWSRRWWDYVSVSAATDAGQTINLSTLMSAQNPLRVINAEVKDYIDVTGTTATRHTICGTASVAAASWTTTAGESEGTYIHTAVISGMKSGGVARTSGGIMLDVNGTYVSFTDGNSSVSDAISIVFELATPTTSTAANIYGTGKTVYSLEDWGVERQTGASGTAAITTAYSQGYPDSLAAIAQVKIKDVVEAVNENSDNIDMIEDEVIDGLGGLDFATLPKLCGQPMKLYGHGVPADNNVPDNWIQLADGGYNWNGSPSALGQEYINVDVTSGGHYEAVRDGYLLKWVNC